MPTSTLSIQDLRQEVKAFGEAVRATASEEDLFIAWFLRAYAVDEEGVALRAVTNGAGDKGVDGIHVDDGGKRVYLIQTKFRKQLLRNTEGKEEVNNLIPILEALKGDEEEAADFTRNLREDIRAPLLDARERLRRRSYDLELCFVSTGRCSPAFREQASGLTRRYDNVEVSLFDGKRVMGLLTDYLDGVAPAVPLMRLPIEGSTRGGGGAISRFDSDTRIESWMFSMSGADVASLYKHAGVRIFARNIRGYLGATQINESMHHTLGHEPNFFWYFNNGSPSCVIPPARSKSGAPSFSRCEIRRSSMDSKRRGRSRLIARSPPARTC